MADKPIAIIAGAGSLPHLVAKNCRDKGQAVVVAILPGVEASWCRDFVSFSIEFERLGVLFDTFKGHHCYDVVFAGAITRPRFHPEKFDKKTLALAPKLLASLGQGDDQTLRVIGEIFTDEGFTIRGAHEIAPDLLATSGRLGRHAPCKEDMADIERATEIAQALGAVDTGQAVVVAAGLCLGIETLQGTDAMLRFVADTDPALRGKSNIAKGVLVKIPKPGQELRMDMPAIGPDTIINAAKAGLAGVAVMAKSSLLLDRKKTVALADEKGLFLFGMQADPPIDTPTDTATTKG